MESVDDTPMDEAEVVYGLDRECALGHVKSRNVFRKNIIFHQHRHQVPARQELHDQIKVEGILERVVQLHDPRRGRLGKNIALCANMRELRFERSTSVLE